MPQCTGWQIETQAESLDAKEKEHLHNKRKAWGNENPLSDNLYDNEQPCATKERPRATPHRGSGIPRNNNRSDNEQPRGNERPSCEIGN
ncbi:hypothetical protein V6N13_038652 [Hibiscus sabdariffa]